MGTNYYLYENCCPKCGRGDSIHIGKDSWGWCFALHVEIHDYSVPPIPSDLEGWIARFDFPGTTIKDEYGYIISRDKMLAIITNRQGLNERQLTPGEYYQNNAVPGPNGLLRHKLDGVHCIAHGEGTWDLIVGEFS